MTDRGASVRVPWLILLGFLLTLFGGAYTYLDARKADKSAVEGLQKQVDDKADKDTVKEIREDVRAIRDYLMPARKP